ncbi:MAG: hypothetical protein KatS3mg121_0330 [Gammaproteobacteria bacterium]|nr:MAG: hypothetical protein KatS3mg121_0330 [Gammaproteobacteria bacterium]
MLALLLAIAVKILSNDCNHLFQTEPAPAFAAYAWTPPA